MARPKPNADGMFQIIWPEKKLVSAEQLMSWASDDASDSHDLPYTCTDLDEAIDILQDTGSVTFGR